MRGKSVNTLKVIRVLLAIIFFTPVLFLFVDFADLLPDTLSRLLHIQIVPAILWGAGILVVVYLLITFIFGRVYCSVICPAGILQDIFNRLACAGKKKKNGSMRFRYHKPANWLRYTLTGITALSAIFGFTELLLLSDPYSNFGRIAANLFRPVVMWLNNLIAGLLSSHGNYLLYHVSIDISTAALISAIAAFLVFAIMVYFRGRLFCNSICPVGALLSLVSRFSKFRIAIDKSACNVCHSCERSCKAEAIHAKNQFVDMSKCVNCFNCISACKRNAVKYCYEPPVITNPAKQSGKKTELNNILKSRRLFMLTSATLAGSVSCLALAQGRNAMNNRRLQLQKRLHSRDRMMNNNTPVTPPGSLNLERFKKYCTGCHLCVVQCPSHVLKPAGLEFGVSYLLKPHMSYENSFCNYTCTVCSEVCPTHAISTLDAAQKKITQVGIAHFHNNRCIVNTEETDCGACSEHCPTQAVHMVPYKGTLTIPKIEPELCIGCGGCESICPVNPKRAIEVIANEIHQTAELPEEEEIRKIDSIDFGF